MIKHQLLDRGVRNQVVLDAMDKVPREEFVPHFMRAFAYDDRPLQIGHHQTISQPFIVGLMTEAIHRKSVKRVLEVGTGSGYQTAVLAELFPEVYSVERILELHLRAKESLERRGYRNIQLSHGDGSKGWPEHAPYDAIIVTAGAAQLPDVYREQLKDRGRLVIPLGPLGDQVLHRFARKGDEWIDEVLSPVSFVPLVSQEESA
jgi:protein-L-isoaspartate(D-aspartate) O-methyltransferase